jgi:hypothetical protein
MQMIKAKRLNFTLLSCLSMCINCRCQDLSWRIFKIMIRVFLVYFLLIILYSCSRDANQINIEDITEEYLSFHYTDSIHAAKYFPSNAKLVDFYVHEGVEKMVLLDYSRQMISIIPVDFPSKYEVFSIPTNIVGERIANIKVLTDSTFIYLKNQSPIIALCSKQKVINEYNLALIPNFPKQFTLEEASSNFETLSDGWVIFTGLDYRRTDISNLDSVHDTRPIAIILNDTINFSSCRVLPVKTIHNRYIKTNRVNYLGQMSLLESVDGGRIYTFDVTSDSINIYSPNYQLIRGTRVYNTMFNFSPQILIKPYSQEDFFAMGDRYNSNVIWPDKKSGNYLRAIFLNKSQQETYKAKFALEVLNEDFKVTKYCFLPKNFDVLYYKRGKCFLKYADDKSKTLKFYTFKLS